MDFLKIECDGDAGLIAMGDGMTVEKEREPCWSKYTLEKKVC